MQNLLEVVSLVKVPGFPTGVANMGGGGGGGPQNLMGGAWGSLKCCQKIPVKELINKLLHTYFSRILARFSVIIYCALKIVCVWKPWVLRNVLVGTA